MFDLHTHVLPGVDDGAPNIEASLGLLAQSAGQGVTHLVMTPHITPGAFDNSVTSIAARYQEVIKQLQAATTIRLAYAAEARIHADLPFAVQDGAVPLFTGDAGQKALLLELPIRDIPAVTDVVLEWLLSEGIRPILAHPERNHQLQQNPGKIQQWHHRGVAMQLTAGSILGDFGVQAKNVAERMLRHDMVTLVASDIHNLDYRPNRMGDARAYVASTYSATLAENLFVHEPARLSGGMYL